MKRAHLYVTGTVQGVFFRESTKEEALRHNVRGWVRNLPDGRVEAVLEGEEYGVDAVIQWCHRGPERARVRHVEVAVEEPTGEFHGFEVLRHGR